MEFLSAVSAGNFARAIALIDQQIAPDAAGTPRHSSFLARAYLNRAFCNYKLQLYRKALKVGLQQSDQAVHAFGWKCWLAQQTLSILFTIS